MTKNKSRMHPTIRGRNLIPDTYDNFKQFVIQGLQELMEIKFTLSLGVQTHRR